MTEDIRPHREPGSGIAERGKDRCCLGSLLLFVRSFRS